MHNVAASIHSLCTCTGLGEFKLVNHYSVSLKIPEDEMLLLQTSSMKDLLSSMNQSLLNSDSSDDEVEITTKAANDR